MSKNPTVRRIAFDFLFCSIYSIWIHFRLKLKIYTMLATSWKTILLMNWIANDPIGCHRHHHQIFQQLPSIQRTPAIRHCTLMTNWNFDIGMTFWFGFFSVLINFEWISFKNIIRITDFIKRNISMDYFSAYVKEKRKKQLWAVEFNNYVKFGQSNVFAALGGTQFSIYECTQNGSIKLLTCFEDPDVSNIIKYFWFYFDRIWPFWIQDSNFVELKICIFVVLIGERRFLHWLLVSDWFTTKNCFGDSWWTRRYSNFPTA